MPLRVHSSRPRDVFYLMDKLREFDVSECIALGSSPHEALLGGLKGQMCFTALDVDDDTGDEVPLMMFGGSRVTENIAVVWALGSDEVRKHPISMYRQGRLFLAQIAAGLDVDTLYNYVSVENTPSVEWLTRLGATFDDDTYEFGGLPFLRFEFQKDRLCAPLFSPSSQAD